MRDAEQIYALYVQANPVPDPDVLPHTRDELVLLPIEGSQEMTTQKINPEHPAPHTTSRNVLVAVGAFAVVLAVGLVAALFMSNRDLGPVAAADAAPVVVFDGDTCTYDGPTEIEEGTVEFSITNSADIEFALGGWLVGAATLEAQLEITPVGADAYAGPDVAPPEGDLVFAWFVSPDESVMQSEQLPIGAYLIDCKTDDHVWRPAQINVVTP